jgi:TolB-like protein
VFLSTSVALVAFLTAGTPLEEIEGRIVVLPLASQRVDAEIVQILDGLLVTATARTSGAPVLGTDELAAALELEGLKDRLGCSDMTCATEIGGALDAGYTVSGSVGRLGDSIILQLRMIDVSEMRVHRRADVTIANDENELEGAVRRGVSELFSDGVARAAGARTGSEIVRREETSVDASKQHHLTVNSLPLDAHVFLDGEHIGTTPFAAMIEAGAHKLVVEIDEHEAYEAAVEAWPGRSTERTMRLHELSELQAERRSYLIGGWATILASTGALVGGIVLIRNSTSDADMTSDAGTSLGSILGGSGLLTLALLGYTTGGVVLASAPDAPLEPRYLPEMERKEVAEHPRTGGFYTALRMAF